MAAIRYPWVWLVFAASMLAGAGLVSRGTPVAFWWGLVLLGAPLLAVTALSLVYYVRQRRAAP